MAIYNVSKDGPTVSIQEAVNQAIADIESQTTISEDYEILIGEGSYKGFTIPDGSLLPFLGTVYKFKVSAAGKFFPTLDFNNGSEDNSIGIDIGSGNPNVVITSLRAQYFAVGLRAAANSHEIIIKNCIFSNNRNSGIFIENCHEVQILQNIIVSGDYGIVSRLCKDAAIVHNTIFLNGNISTVSGVTESGIWANTALNYGGGLSDTGYLYIIGNIVWNTAGRCLTLFQDDYERGSIVSNYNNLVSSENPNYISLEDRIFYSGSNSKPRRSFSTLAAWKELGNDANSISSDPKFISPIKNRSGRRVSFVDLNLLSISPVLGKVPSFYVDASATAEWLPSYVDSASFSKDIIGNTRLTNGTAIGSNDKSVTSGFYGQDIFSNFINQGTIKNCDVDPLQYLLDKNLDVWYPKLKKGYFYSRDREFYLYADKRTKYLGELAVTEFILPEPIVTTKPIVVYINGTKISDPGYIDIQGDKLIIKHKDLFILSGEEEIDIQYFGRKWNGNGFSYHQTHILFKINQGKTRFFLPEEYVASGPIVITDDRASPIDPDQSANREFSVSFNEKENLSELKFASNSNKVLNGQFDYADGNAPLFWESSLATITSSELSGSYPAYGDNYCTISPSGYIAQIVDTRSGETTLSWHGKGTGTIDYSIEYYDHNRTQMGFVTTGSVDLVDSWTRYYSVFGATGDSLSSFIPEAAFSLSGLGYHDIPDNPVLAEIKFSNRSDTDLYIDGVQFEDSIRPSLYHRKVFFTELTIEYESSEEDSYIDTNQAISPIRNLLFDGFLCIPEITADLYNGPLDPLITTFHEWRWAHGRINILPWARTLGKDKLRKRTKNKFHNIPQDKPQISNPALWTPSPSAIKLYPSLPICVRGNHGVGINIKCLDDYGNPSGLSPVWITLYDSRGSFPGWLFKSFYGLKEQLSTKITTTLDNSGGVSLLWIPPDESSGRWVGQVPSLQYETTTSRALSYIDLKYPINSINSGNVLILTQSNVQLPVHPSEPLIKTYIPTYYDNRSVIVLDYVIKQGSVKVWVDGRQVSETSFNSPETDQFYVNYQESKIYLKGRTDAVYIEYIPIYVYYNLENPYRLFILHDKVFGDYQGAITVDYDYNLELQVDVGIPGSSEFLTKFFSLVAQNPLTSRRDQLNQLALEI